MQDSRQQDLFNQARVIVDRLKIDPGLQQQVLDDLKQSGIIDDQGRVVFPENGRSDNGRPIDTK
jgi:hypothetical protein